MVKRVIIAGRVQGVGFRYFVLRAARKSGVSGWVRNLPDGTVEVVYDDDKGDIESFERLIKKGPPTAKVESVYEDKVALEVNNGFTIKF